MASLLLGPILRHVEATEATLWVQTDVACEVEALGFTTPTFQVEGHHFALLELKGLEPDATYEYAVRLDGELVWPETGSSHPPSLIRTVGSTSEVKLVFGSCRVALPHHPPYALREPDHESAQGVDALRTLALQLMNEGVEDRPHCLLMLGDQIYADDLSPAMLAVTRNRTGAQDAPGDELADFEEYALAYREAWGDPVIRWLLSTVATATIFDDHEIHSQWKISREWVQEMSAKPWYDRHISGGLMAYWIYQHLGNLSPAELDGNELVRRMRAEPGDAGPLLREEMSNANRQPDHSRWSFARDLGTTRLVVIDTRAGRELGRGERRIIDDGEWEWVTTQARGDFDHLLLASSVPFFLPTGLHYAEAWNEAVADGAWGRRASRIAEPIRRAAVMDHWASFQRSFERLAKLVEDVATGSNGSEPPGTVLMLSGDVHHCYLAEVGFPGTAPDPRSAVWQCVCSAYRKDLARREKAAMKLGNSCLGAFLARTLARATGIGPPRAEWRLVRRPSYENQVATLELAPGHAQVRMETTAGTDWRNPALATVFEHRLDGQHPPPDGR